jgi:hypothetical protein
LKRLFARAGITTSGGFILQSAGNSTFTAAPAAPVATPEPAALVVFGTLAVGAFGLRRRYKATA